MVDVSTRLHELSPYILSLPASLSHLSHFPQLKKTFMNWHIMVSEFTCFIKSFVKLLTIKKSFMNCHVMMSEFTCLIKSFVTLLTIKNSFVNWHVMLCQFTCFVKSFITLLTIKKRVEVICEASYRPLHRKAFY